MRPEARGLEAVKMLRRRAEKTINGIIVSA
jgi:hypothetical protein